MVGIIADLSVAAYDEKLVCKIVPQIWLMWQSSQTVLALSLKKKKTYAARFVIYIKRSIIGSLMETS